MILKRSINSYFNLLFCCIVFLATHASDVTSGTFDSVWDIHKSVYSNAPIIKYSDKLRASYNQTDSTMMSPCYIRVNSSDSEDLYNKAASAGDCTLVISGHYRLDKPLRLSGRVEAEEEPVIQDDYQEGLFLPVKQDSGIAFATDFTLLTPVVQDYFNVLPAAVLTIDSTNEASSLELLFGSSLSGIGIKTEQGTVHESGCTLSGVYFKGVLLGDIYWSHPQHDHLCSRQHLDLNHAGMECAAPRECAGNRRRNRHQMESAAGSVSKQKEKVRVVEYNPPENGSGASAAVGGTGGSGKKGNGKKDDDDEYQGHFRRVEAAFVKYRDSGRKGQQGQALKNEWDKVPKRLREKLQDQMRHKHGKFSDTQKRLGLNT